MSSTVNTKHKLLELADMINTAKNLNRALFMACGDVMDTFAVNALQALSEEIDERINVIRDCVEELGEDFA